MVIVNASHSDNLEMMRREQPLTMGNASIYKSTTGRSALMEWYNAKLSSISIHTEGQEVSTSFGKTHIVIAGDSEAPPLIVLHGMNMNGPSMANAMVALSKTHRVYAIDIIGMPGKSADTRPSRAGNDYAQWLVDVLEQLNLLSADFLGLSFGGWIILKLAAYSPERVNKAVLINSGGFTPFTFRGKVLAGWSAIWYRLFPNERNLIRAVHPFFAQGCKPDPEIVKLIGLGYQYVKFDIDPKGLPPLTEDELANFSGPTMVLFGENDIFFNAEKGIQIAKQTIPNLVMAEVIAGQGHLIGEEAQSQVYGKIGDFLTDSL